MLIPLQYPPIPFPPPRDVYPALMDDNVDVDVDTDNVLPMDVWAYVQYDYRKVPENFSLVATDACNRDVGNRRWLRLYGHARPMKSPAARLLAETLDALLHQRPVEQSLSCPWIATRISSFIDRRRTYACLSSLSWFTRKRLIGNALTEQGWVHTLKACRPCTRILGGDEVAIAGLHVLNVQLPSTRYIATEVRASTSAKALLILRVKRGRVTYVESATWLAEKDASGTAACCKMVGKRATLDIVMSKSGKKHLYLKLPPGLFDPLSTSKVLLNIVSVGTVPCSTL